MESRKGKLIQAFGDNEQVGLFRIVENACPIDHFEEVIFDYFSALNGGDEVNANLILFRWGLERVYIDYEVNI